MKDEKQLLNGEYGAWRTLGLHSGKYSEDAFTALLKKKAELAAAEAAKKAAEAAAAAEAEAPAAESAE